MGDESDLTDQLLAAAELLEAVSADRSILDALTAEERIRFLNAAANAFEPDVDARRRQTKARRRQEKVAKVQRDEDVLTETGIRRLRGKPVFMTPNVFPPDDGRRTGADRRPAPTTSSTATSASRSTSRSTTSTTSCARPAPRSASPSAPRRPTSRGRVALLTGGRVKIGYQAGIKLLRAGASLIVTTRFPRDAALRYSRGGRLRRLGRPARGLRARPAAHAERGGPVRPPARHPARASTTS